MHPEDRAAHVQARRNNPFLVGLVIACIIAIWLFLFIITAFDLRAYSKDATAVKGKLEDVIWNSNRTLDLCIDGNTYTLSKDSSYSSRSFGVLNDMPLSKLADVLDAYTGQKVSLEYVAAGLGGKGNRGAYG